MGKVSSNKGSVDKVAEKALMLYRYAGAGTVNGDLSAFVDAGSVYDWALEAMNWAVAQGIIGGKDGARLDPAGNATRAEAATMLQRLAELAE